MQSFAPAPARSRVTWPADVPVPARTVDEPLVLPEPAPPARRAQLPLLASIVPVIAAVALWLVTGSVYSLWFALLGPLIAVATLLDGRRATRRDRRTAQRDAAAARERVAGEIERRHAGEHVQRWTAHPDVAALAADDTRVWRSPRTLDAQLVVGRGAVESAVRVSGGGDGAEARAVRASAMTLRDAPVTVPLRDGVAVTGPPVLAAAVTRALVLQACLLLPPGALRIVGAATGEGQWSAALPHRRSDAGLSLLIAGPGDDAASDTVIARVDPGASAPPWCAAVLTVTRPDRAELVHAGATTHLEVEALGARQAAEMAQLLAERAEEVFPDAADTPIVRLGDLLDRAPAAAPGALAAVIGSADGTAIVVDLVADGPHAVVAGVTGSGKSELLITWVAALCATHSPRDVSFLLADFKGGTAFDGLRDLPHVTGVITDLDGAGARRALESLGAEVRRRESELARVGARDIADARVAMPRLVVVVDEFAALMSDHPELQPIFTDVAARGRALGMHLVLGTQRVAGVIRDALLANCPLRLSLRVTDTADSRAVIGTDEAARLPGGAASRGVALLRRAGDSSPRRIRVALTDSTDIASATAVAGAESAPWRPWLPELPSRIPLESLLRESGHPDGSLVLGLADEPHRQRQETALLGAGERGLLVVGMAGSGRSTALAAIAHQVPDRLLRWVPADPEGAWDAVARLERAPSRGAVVIVDDLDALLARYPVEYAHIVGERLERVTRGAGDAGIRVVVSAQRLAGAAARIAELLPRRAILAMPTRADHVAAGGDGAGWSVGTVAGRASLDGRAVQLAYAAGGPPLPATETAPAWSPRSGVTGVVTRRGAAARLAAALRAAGAAVVPLDDAAPVVESPRPFDTPVVIVADPDAWQRAWRVLGAVRVEHDLVIDVGCAAEYRALTGDREPPPYCAPRPGRAWLLSPGEPPHRVHLPGEA